jgi:hypothetical protein
MSEALRLVDDGCDCVCATAGRACRLTKAIAIASIAATLIVLLFSRLIRKSLHG